MPNVSYPSFDSLSMLSSIRPGKKPQSFDDEAQAREDAYRQRVNASYDQRNQQEAQNALESDIGRDLLVRGRSVTAGGVGGSSMPGFRSRSKNLSQPQNPRYMDGFGNQMPASDIGDRLRLMDLGLLGVGGNNGALRYSIGGQVVPRGTIPQFARGGTMPQDGPAIVGEQGPELVNLPAGAQVTPIENADQYSRLGSRTDPSSRVGSALNPLVLTDRTLQGEIDKERNVPQDKRLYGPTTGLGQDYQTPNMADFLKGGLSLSEIMRKKYELEDKRNQIRDLQRSDATDSPEIDQATSRYDQLIPYLNELAQSMQGYVPGLASSKQPGVVASIANRNNSGADLNRSRMGTEASKQYYYDAGGNLRDTQSDEIVTQSPHVSARTDAQAYNQNSQGDQHQAQASFIEDTTQPTVDKITAQADKEKALAGKAGRNPTSDPSGMKPKDYIGALQSDKKPYDAKIDRIDKILNNMMSGIKKGSPEDLRLREQRDKAQAESDRIAGKINAALTGESNQAFGQLNQPQQRQARAVPPEIQQMAEQAVRDGKFSSVEEALSHAKRKLGY